MQVIDDSTVVVTSYDELKQALEGDNGYIYIYFGSNITLTGGITINENKKIVTIDGTYLGVRYILTGTSTALRANSILASTTNEKIIIKNIDAVYGNAYGVLCVIQEKAYENVVTEYRNVKFNGTEMAYNQYGKAIIIDCNITIETTGSVAGQEACEAKVVEIGGNTTIVSNSTSFAIFSFRSDITPSITFLPNSNINLTSTYKEFMSGTNKLDFKILHNAVVNLTTYSGFTFDSSQGVMDVLIDEGATFNFVQKAHRKIPMWNIYGSFTVNEGANMSVMDTYDSPTDNYSIYFKGTANKIVLNNPNKVILYTKNSNIFYTINQVDFEFNFSRLNLWTNSADLSVAGSISNLPDFSWYKEDDLVSLTGSFTSSSTTINTNNFTQDELNNLPDLSNLSFQSKKQLSIGTSIFSIDSVTVSSSAISGYALPYQDVLIEYDNVNEIVSADEKGFFRYDLSDAINDGTIINITVNLAGSFIYNKRSVLTPYEGELIMMSVPENISFLLNPISTSPIIFPKSEQIEITVIDSRTTSSNWKLYVSISNDFLSANNLELPQALIFKNTDSSTITLSDNPQLVFTGSNNNGVTNVTNIVWDNEHGPLLCLANIYLEANEEYNTKIIWNIEE